MRYTTFVSELKQEGCVEIPSDVRDKLDLREGDKLEVTIKKIKTRRLEILISQNPLHKLLTLKEN